MKKGQMFVIAAIVITIALVSIKGIFGVFTTIEEKNFQEANTLDRQLENIKNEYEYAVNIAWHKENVSNSGIDYLQNLSKFVQSETKDTADLEAIYAYVYYNNTRKKYTVTVGNFLGDSINATIETMKSTVSQVDFGEIKNENYKTHEFSLDTQGSYQNYNGINISLNYIIKNENIFEKITLDADKDTSILFYDISLERDNRIRIKDIYSIKQQQFKEVPGSAQQTATCGNNQIESGEDCCNCPEDVGACSSVCGNDECEICEDETTCFDDCGQSPEPYCGDGFCNFGEYCWNCAQDCGSCGGGGGGGCCFIAGTKITMADFSVKTIEDIKVGDRVLSFDNGKIIISTVEQTFILTNKKTMYKVTTEDGEFDVASGHFIYSNGSYVAVDELKTGDIIHKIEKNELLPDRIVKIDTYGITENTYNFEVDEAHNYFANGYLVHNKVCNPCQVYHIVTGEPNPGC